jgi:hypothetical protein
MARLSQILGFLFFILVMGWGAWATLFEHQLKGENIGNLPEVGSPVLPNTVIIALPIIGIAIVILGAVGKFLATAKSTSQTSTPRRRASDFDDDDIARPKIDDSVIAAAAARYQAEQLAQQQNASNFQPQAPSNGPVTFGRRKTD